MIVEHGRVALIRRERPGRAPYYLFPGRKVEEGETPEQAAVREAREELGVRVALDGLLAVETFEGSPRHYYRARIVGGAFGTGTGAEMSSPPGSARGSYTPIWVALDELGEFPVYPRLLASLPRSGHAFVDPVRFVDTEPA